MVIIEEWLIYFYTKAFDELALKGKTLLKNMKRSWINKYRIYE
jgi:hypothetical protein